MTNPVLEETAATTGGWGRLQRLVPIVVGGGLLALILSRTDLAKLGAVLLQVQWQWYGVAQLLLVVNLLLISCRWRYNLGLLQLRYPFVELFLIDNAGSLAGAATPGRMGDLARLIYFRQEKNLLVRVGLSILVERGFDLIVLVWLSTAFVWFLPLLGHFQWLVLKLAVIGHLVGLGTAIVLWRSRGGSWLAGKVLRCIPADLQARWAGSVEELKAALSRYATWRVLWSLTLTLLAWGCNILSAQASAQALALPLSLWQTGACFCLSTLFTLIPVSVAGIGTRELALIYLFSCLGLPAEQALAFSFLLLGFLISHSLIGFLALLIKPPRVATGKPQQSASA